MLSFIIFIASVSHLPAGLCTKHACVPNTQFVSNGQICFCDNKGRWNVSNCKAINRRTCTASQIIWQGCNQCVCQENGRLLCNNAACYENITGENNLDTSTAKYFDNHDSMNTWCTPFKSYYINCSICVCSPSGRISESHCVTDNSCQHQPPSTSDFLASISKNICIPKVMYLFSCLHCLCSDEGYFVQDQCVETCHRSQQTTLTRRCISRTFYRKNCNICWCPDDSVVHNKYCTQTVCKKEYALKPLQTLKAIQRKCKVNTFLKPKCFYCNCDSNGNMNEKACLESDCLKHNYFKYDVLKTACSPGEMVPICRECLCIKGGVTNQSYCSEVCSYQSKLNVLEKVLRDNQDKYDLIEKEKIERTIDNNNCQPNSIYLDQSRYCLCPENGSTNFKLCTSIIDEMYLTKLNRALTSLSINDNLNSSCDPNTFVEFDCNTCYCGKNGRIDPKWCTNDDCEAKRMVQYGQNALRLSITQTLKADDKCIPGSITTAECNFCICPHSGIVKEGVCTKKLCSEIQHLPSEKFTCEPLAYYLVDCNVCLCPRDGMKNVEKCTKKICEKTILRSDSCTPGQLFSNECNICICPPNGNKADSACTEHKCYDTEAPWNKIFRLSQILLNSKLVQKTPAPKKYLDFCFSGEEFEIGCKICVCPDVGLKSYATCSETRCDEKNSQDNNRLDIIEKDMSNIANQKVLVRRKRHPKKQKFKDDQPAFHKDSDCFTFNLTDSSERKECTPGSMYIIRCRQCICPYMGNINHFCRALPKGMYCEQAFPNFNYLAMGRRIDGDESAVSNASSTVLTAFVPNKASKNTSEVNSTKPNSEVVPAAAGYHTHTKYKCIKPGKVLDECFICECEDDVVIEEHCFKSEAEKCEDDRPTFLDNINKVVIGF